MRFTISAQQAQFGDSLNALLLKRQERLNMTSLNIIGEVINLPLPALECIWRKTGNPDIEPSSLCIDEKSLELFAEAFVRKIKNYFVRSIKDFENLSIEERIDLTEFYNHFKIKEDTNSLISKSSWSNVDIVKLQEAFLIEVREKTEKYILELYNDIFGASSISIEHFEKLCTSLSSQIEAKQPTVLNNGNLLSRISHSYRYLSPHNNVRDRLNKKHRVKNSHLRKVYKSARFYIYVADDNPDNDIFENYSETVKRISYLFKIYIQWTKNRMSLSRISKRAIFR